MANRIRFMTALGLLAVFPGIRRTGIGDLLSGPQALVAPHHDQITGLEAAQHLEARTDRFTELNRPQGGLGILREIDHRAIRLLDDAVLVDGHDGSHRADGQIEGDALPDRQWLGGGAKTRGQAHGPGAGQRVLLGHHRPDVGFVLRAVIELERHRGPWREPREAVVRDVGLDLQLLVVDQRGHRIANLDEGAGTHLTLAHHAGERRPNHRVLEIPGAELQLGAILLNAGCRRHDPALRDGDLVFLVDQLGSGERGRAFELGHAVALTLEQLEHRPLGRPLRQGRTVLGLGEIALEGQGLVVEPSQRGALFDAIADLDRDPIHQAPHPRRDRALLARDNTAQHRHGLGKRFRANRVDLNSCGTSLALDALRRKSDRRENHQQAAMSNNPIPHHIREDRLLRSLRQWLLLQRSHSIRADLAVVFRPALTASLGRRGRHFVEYHPFHTAVPKKASKCLFFEHTLACR
jgi:hypothetical protein